MQEIIQQLEQKRGAARKESEYLLPPASTTHSDPILRSWPGSLPLVLTARSLCRRRAKAATQAGSSPSSCDRRGQEEKPFGNSCVIKPVSNFPETNRR